MFAEIKLKDLASDCPDCHGEGLVSKQTGAAGAMMTTTNKEPCPACKGEKLILTTAGRTLVDFVRMLQVAGILPSR